MGYNYTPIKTTIKRKNNLRIPSTGKDVEQLELSHIAEKNAKLCSHFGKSLAVSHQDKHIFTI